jgi:hypothetical protein
MGEPATIITGGRARARAQQGGIKYNPAWPFPIHGGRSRSASRSRAAARSRSQQGGEVFLLGELM